LVEAGEEPLEMTGPDSVDGPMKIGAYDVDAAAMPEGGGEAKSWLFVDQALCTEELPGE